MELPPGLLHIMKQTHLFTDGVNYVILRLPQQQAPAAARLLVKLTTPFKALVLDKDELTLVLSQQAWEELEYPLEIIAQSPTYRLITFDLPLDLGLVGYLATLSAILAEAGISIFPVAAFSRDHILVQAEEFDRAWEALRTFLHTCQELEYTEHT
ncbi:MAG: ACT domain-containing protein [Anaerolineae bacterium]|nr:ACT domain-containing protein [Anaerolineae bacterium]